MNQFNQNTTEIPFKKIRPFIFIGLLIIFLIMFGNRMFIILQPTEKGVVFHRFGNGLDVDHIYSEGLSVMMPWNEMLRFDISEQRLEESMDVLSSNGLSIQVDVSVRFRPKPEEVGRLYQKFKSDYTGTLVRQELRSAVRRIIGRYTAEELYSTKREEIEKTISEITFEIFDRNFVDLRALLIRSVKLPTSIQDAIETKLKQEQEFLAYQFKLQKEKSEAQRKKIAAEGESEANKIINNSLTEALLKMRGIEATTDLAKSANAKVIVIGSGKDGLPLILGNN